MPTRLMQSIKRATAFGMARQQSGAHQPALALTPAGLHGEPPRWISCNGRPGLALVHADAAVSVQGASIGVWDPVSCRVRWQISAQSTRCTLRTRSGWPAWRLCRVLHKLTGYGPLQVAASHCKEKILTAKAPGVSQV
jgi:hypothetical protein